MGVRSVPTKTAEVVALRSGLDGRSDDELMALAKLGRKDAFAVLAARHTKRLVQLCAVATGDRASAEEIAQDVWVAVWSTRADYEPRGKFFVFLVSAARNRCRNHARDAARRSRWVRPADDAIVAPSAEPSEIDRLLARERVERLEAALGEIPEKMREAIVLRFGEGLSYEAIAEVVDANPSTLRSRVHHALLALRQRLGDGTAREEAP
jgi:RNA polymerase sigma-70 factor (ECF subfamily)